MNATAHPCEEESIAAELGWFEALYAERRGNGLAALLAGIAPATAPWIVSLFVAGVA